MKIIATLILFLISFLVTSFAQADAVKVAVTSPHLADLVYQIGQDRVKIYPLKESFIADHPVEVFQEIVSQADLIMAHGLNYDLDLIDALTLIEQQERIYYVANVIPENLLLYEQEVKVNPYVWFDPYLWKMMVAEVTRILISYDKESEDFYLTNQREYLDQVYHLEDLVEERLKSIPAGQRLMIVNHQGWKYFARKYFFEIINFDPIGKNPDDFSQHMIGLVELIMDRKVQILFDDVGGSPQNLSFILSEVHDRHRPLAVISPLYYDHLLPIGSEQNTYIGMFLKNFTMIESVYP